MNVMTPYIRTRTWHQRDEDLSALGHDHRVPVPPCVSVHARGLTDNVQYSESVMLCVELKGAMVRRGVSGMSVIHAYLLAVLRMFLSVMYVLFYIRL